jgi:hypothetical protein
MHDVPVVDLPRVVVLVDLVLLDRREINNIETMGVLYLD